MLLLSNIALANECKTTTVTIEKDGKVSNESATICKETGGVDLRVKIGDTILASEVNESHAVKGYFKHNGHKCRMFEESGVVDKKIRDYYGVICQIDPKDENNWIVVDKW
jgi:hypothetical protein